MFFTFRTVCPFCGWDTINTISISENEVEFYGVDENVEEKPCFDAVHTCNSVVCDCGNSDCDKDYVATLSLSPKVICRKIEGQADEV